MRKVVRVEIDPHELIGNQLVGVLAPYVFSGMPFEHVKKIATQVLEDPRMWESVREAENDEEMPL